MKLNSLVSTSTFSGGQAQRILIARALARELVASLGDAVRDGVLPPRGDERLGDLPQLLERLGMQDALRELRDADRRRR